MNERLTVIIGPSGAGKSIHVQRLLQEHPAELVRTYTDRPRRGADDDDTHIFVTRDALEAMKQADQLLGSGTMLGYQYGLPRFSLEGDPKVVLLRAPFVPAVKEQQPNAAIIQFEAAVPTLMERLHARGDAARADAESLAKEIALGRKLASYVISTELPFEQSYKEFERAWHDIHSPAS